MPLVALNATVAEPSLTGRQHKTKEEKMITVQTLWNEARRRCRPINAHTRGPASPSPLELSRGRSVPGDSFLCDDYFQPE